MSEKNLFGWAEQAGKQSTAAEATTKAKKAADVAEQVLQHQIASQREAEFSKKAEELLQSLSNHVQYAVNAFNRGAGVGTKVDSPVRNPHGVLGLTIAKRVYTSSGSASEPRYPNRPVHTTVEVSTTDRTLSVSHTHYFGRKGVIEYPEIKDLDKMQTYSLGVDTDGGIVVSDGDNILTLDALAKQICLPLFEYQGPTA